MDDVKIGIDSVNKLLLERGLPIVDSVQSYHAVFGFPIIEYYKKLGFDFEKESFEIVAPLWVNEYISRLPEAPMREGAIELLEFFKSCKVRQSIISATEREMLLGQLRSLGIEHFFDEIYGLDNIHAAGKTHLASAWREKHPSVGDRALFIGDTTHDAEVASFCGSDCVLVCGGHQSEETLKSSGCKTVIGLHELLMLLENDGILSLKCQK